MNEPAFNAADSPSRSFATDVPHTDLTVGSRTVSNKLWAGMATAAVVAAVGVGALAVPAPIVLQDTTAAAPVAEAAPERPAGVEATAQAGSGTDSSGTVQGQAAALGDVPAAEVPPAEVPSAAPPATETPPEAAPAAPAEPAPAPEPAPAAPAADPNLHTVVPGDTVGAIAARFGVDMNVMLAANGLGPSSIIVPGQTLVLTGPAVDVPVAAPVQAGAPAPAAAPAAAPAPPPAAAPAFVPAAPAVRTIYVAGAGGQAMVDACIGPIHYTPNDGYSLFITEHDFCGGWGRFSGIVVGETVSIPGYGTYAVTARGQVPNPGTTNDVIAVFGGFPRAILQTCIPGTTQMLLIALN